MGAPPKKAPRRIPTQDRARVTVDTILLATDQLARAGGVEQLTMVEVAKRSGVGVGTLYHYFAGLEPLLAAWEETRWQKMANTLVEQLQKIVMDPPQPEESIATLIGAGFDLMMEHMSYFKNLENAAFTSRVAARVRVARGVVDSFAPILASGPHRARWRDRDRRASARMIIVTTAWTAYDAYSAEVSPDELAQIRSELQSMAVTYLIKDAVTA